MKQRNKTRMLFTLMLVAAGVFYFDGKRHSVFGQDIDFHRQELRSVARGESRTAALENRRQPPHGIPEQRPYLFSASLPPAQVQRKPEPAPTP